MIKQEAIHYFWSLFNLPVYDENSVPDEIYDFETGNMIKVKPPYITYSVSTGSLNDVLAVSASIWYRSTSWRDIALKTDEISDYIGFGGQVIKYDDHSYLWITRGEPFAQRMGDPNDDLMKRIYLNVNFEFLAK